MPGFKILPPFVRFLDLVPSRTKPCDYRCAQADAVRLEPRVLLSSSASEFTHAALNTSVLENGGRLTWEVDAAGADSYRYSIWQTASSGGAVLFSELVSFNGPTGVVATTGYPTGSFFLRVEARIDASTEPIATTDLPFAIVAPTVKSLTVQLPAGSLIQGGTLNVAATATGGTGNFEYSYFLRGVNGRWSQQSPWVNELTSIDEARHLAPGKYLLCVVARCVGNNQRPWDVHSTKYLNVTSNAESRVIEVPTELMAIGVGTLPAGEEVDNFWISDRQAFAASEHANHGTIVIAGDSAAWSWSDLAGSELARHASALGIQFSNVGLRGDTSRGLLNRLHEDVLALSPSAIVLTVGQGELASKSAKDNMIANLRAIISQVHLFDQDLAIVLTFPSAEWLTFAEKSRLSYVYNRFASSDPNIVFHDVLGGGLSDSSGTPTSAELVEAYRNALDSVATHIEALGLNNRYSVQYQVTDSLNSNEFAKNATLRVRSTVSGGGQSHQYRHFLRQTDGLWQAIDSDLASTDAYVYLNGFGAGDYELLTIASSSLDGTTIHARDVSTFRITDRDALELSVDIPRRIIAAGDSLVVSPGMSSSSDGLEYTYFVRPIDGRWSPAVPWGSAPTEIPEATSLVPGDYLLQVRVRTIGSDSEWEDAVVEPFTVRPSNDAIWQSLLDSYLLEPLWEEDSAYDAVNVLMLPMHTAFGAGDTAKMEQFGALFQRWMDADHPLPSHLTIRTQWMYLVSQFIKEAHKAGSQDIIPSGLEDALQTEVIALWTTTPAWQWRQPDFPGGMRERYLWRRANTEPDQSYDRVFTDQDFFVFAAASDLSFVATLEEVADRNETIDEIVSWAIDLFVSEAVFSDEGEWYFQPGVWRDHRDFIYAGHTVATVDMEIAKVEGIGNETAHSHRMPLWLRSFEDGASTQEEALAVKELRLGLERQFINKVLQAPTSPNGGYLTTNFISGDNGIYRYNYLGREGRDGLPYHYRPWESSGSWIFGWWTFLGTQRIRDAYQDMTQRFPLDDATISLYLGPDTPRPRHEILYAGANYTNGLAELHARLGATIGE